MIEKGIERPPRLSVNRLDAGNRGGILAIFDYLIELVKWAQRLQNVFPKVQTFEVTIDPPSGSADSDQSVNVTLNGVTTQDILFINKPSVTSDVGIVGAYVSAANTGTIHFRYFSGGTKNPPSENYYIVAVRR
jgi:hypothetical protein